jgi:hypothetical protein
VIVLSEPLPPSSIFPLVTTVVTLEVALTSRVDAGVSASPILNGIAAVGVFSAVV